jgi:hypothetical protein
MHRPFFVVLCYMLCCGVLWPRLYQFLVVLCCGHASTNQVPPRLQHDPYVLVLILLLWLGGGYIK